ncbi:MAG TPA: hypothetical protein VLX28_16030 [Thermoanaerobaculia bacterium]|nr:hypothetical protein [Thermoanaerobaculia bacterium]
MITLATLAALPAAAAEKEYGKGKGEGKGGGTEVKKGTDYWRTPASGTKVNFAEGDVESLCKHKPDSAWNHEVSLRGIPAQGSDWDSAVTRLTDAKFDKAGNASTRIQFKTLTMISNAPSDTPCGKLIWTTNLAKGAQPVTAMKITKKSPRGGVFSADLALRVEMQANNAETGAYVGSLFYDVKLPDPQGGTPWSFSDRNAFQAGVDEAGKAVEVQRVSPGRPGQAGREFVTHIYVAGHIVAVFNN